MDDQRTVDPAVDEQAFARLRVDLQLCVALVQLVSAVQGQYRPHLDRLGITYRQYTVLLVLWEHTTIPMRELGEILHLDSGTLSPLLKRMESAGLLRRRKVPRDDRIVLIEVTDKGRDLQFEAVAVQCKVQEASGLDDEALGVMRDQVKALTRRLREAPIGLESD